MYLLLLVLAVLSISCTRYTDLNDSLYINDPNFNGLPAYTERGYNTFGAYYDRNYFLYSRQETPLKITVQDEHISYIFQGIKGNHYPTDNYMSVTFIIPDSTTNKYQDLIEYDEQIFNLTDPDIRVRITTNGITNDVEVLEGLLNFKRVQTLYVDDAENQLIMSGNFELKFLNNDIPANLSYGRFDFGVDDLIFYYLP